MYNKVAETKDIQKKLVSQVKTACHEQKIPFIFLAAAADDGKTTEWICDGIPAGEFEGVTLSDDRIRRALAILNGFDDELFENKAVEASKGIPEIILEEETLTEGGIDDDEFNAGLVEES